MSRPPVPPWDAVLFDLDGTLANTVPLILTCFRHAMAVHRPHEEPDVDLLLANVGRTLRETMAEFTSDPVEADAIRATYVARQEELHDEMVTPCVGALGLVERYAAHRTPIAIVTSKGRAMTARTMNVCALDVHFEHVITADDVENGKPHPEPVLLALERLGVPASERVVFIGDSPHDIVAGRRAGVTTVGVPWGASTAAQVQAAAPHHFIRRWDEMFEVERRQG